MKSLLLSLSLVATAAAIAQVVPYAIDNKATVFEYQNPIRSGIHPRGIRDSQVFRDGDWWYLTGTSYPFWPREEQPGKVDELNPGVQLYRSKNLTDWEFVKTLVERPTPDKWWFKRFWAPEVHRVGKKWVVLLNCSNPEAGYPGQHMGYAVADELTGPYRVVTADKPLTHGNDLTIFQDEDGKVWAFWNRGRDFGIGFAQLDLDKGVFLTEPKSAILPGKVDMAFDAAGKPLMQPAYDGRPEHKVAKFYEWDSIGIEGPWVFKRQGRYYLMYSSWTRGYEIGYATAPSITGPWTKADHNPVYGAQHKGMLEKNGIPFTGDPDTPFNQVGHNELFTGPDGRLWLSAHGIVHGDPRPALVIDPLDFDAQGRIQVKRPTHTRQSIPLKN